METQNQSSTQHIFPELESVQALREELELKAHLMKSEIMEKWSELDAKWQKLSSNVKNLRDASATAKDDVVAATEILMKSLQEGYENIARRINITH